MDLVWEGAWAHDPTWKERWNEIGDVSAASSSWFFVRDRFMWIAVYAQRIFPIVGLDSPATGPLSTVGMVQARWIEGS